MSAAASILNKQHHARLLADGTNICRVANIPRSMLDKSAKDFCSGVELDYLKRYPHYLRQGKSLALVGHHEPGVDTKMQAMTAAFLRNYIDARIITVQGLLDEHQHTDSFPDPTVLLIPNLSVKQTGKALTAWMTQLVYDLLLARQSAGKATIVYIEDMDAMVTQFGSLFSQHINEHYEISESKK